MARTTRQSKILEIISSKEIETQDELVYELKVANYDVTQATISRDIKELGLIKILSSDSKKYKYAIVNNDEQAISTKYINILKESIISAKPVNNLVVVKTIKGIASSVCSLIDKLNLENIMGTVFGDDSVMIIMPTNHLADEICTKINYYLS